MLTTITFTVWCVFLVVGLALLAGAYYLYKIGEPASVALFFMALWVLMIPFFPITIVWFLVDRYQYQKSIKRYEKVFRAS